MLRRIGCPVALLAVAFSCAQTAVPRAGANAPPAGTARIVGRVVDRTTGRPVTNYAIRIETPLRTHAYGDRAHGIFASSGHYAGSKPISDPNGRFELSLEAEPVTLGFVADGHATETIGPFSLRRGITEPEVTVKLGPAYTLEGRVVDEMGSPIEGATVSVVGPAGEPASRAARVPQIQVKSAKDGSYRLDNLDSGGIQLWIGRRGSIAVAPIVVVAGSERAHDVVLTPAATLRGMVVDDRGKPVAGAAVQATPKIPRYDLTSIPEAWLRAESDTDGKFLLDSLRPDDYTIRAAKSGMTTRTADVHVSEAAAVRLAIAPAGSVTGRVAADARVLNGFAAYAWAAGEEYVAPIDGGAFRFDALPAGKVEIAIERRGPSTFLHSARVPLIVAAGQTSDCTVPLSESVAGTLQFAATGRPALLRFTSQGEVTKAEVEVEPGGSFHVAGLDPASYQVEITIAGIPLDTSIDIRRDHRLDLDLRGLYSIKTEVLNRETGDPVFPGYVTLRQVTQGIVNLPDQRRPLGSTSFWNMPSGEYELTINADRYQTRTVRFRVPEENGKAAEILMERIPVPFTCELRAPVPPLINSYDIEVLTAVAEAYAAAQPQPLHTPGFDPRHFYLLADVTAVPALDKIYPNSPDDKVDSPDQQSLIRLMRTTVWARFVELARMREQRSLANCPATRSIQPICADLVTDIDDLRDLQKDYPTARGILRIGMPALSHDRRAALVDVMEPTAHNESLVYLIRDNGRWTVKWMTPVRFED